MKYLQLLCERNKSSGSSGLTPEFVKFYACEISHAFLYFSSLRRSVVKQEHQTAGSFNKVLSHCF